jgi:hypothetical protein
MRDGKLQKTNFAPGMGTGLQIVRVSDLEIMAGTFL